MGLAVLDVLKTEQLQAHATNVGSFLLEHLTQQKAKHPIIGDVRLKENYILLSIDGPGKNILKFKPPMCFNVDNAQHVVAKLDDILTGKLDRIPSSIDQPLCN